VSGAGDILSWVRVYWDRLAPLLLDGLEDLVDLGETARTDARDSQKKKKIKRLRISHGCLMGQLEQQRCDFQLPT